jgi:hypothetical protein
MQATDFVDYLDTMFDDMSDDIIDNSKSALSDEDIVFLRAIGFEPLIDELA